MPVAHLNLDAILALNNAGIAVVIQITPIPNEPMLGIAVRLIDAAKLKERSDQPAMYENFGLLHTRDGKHEPDCLAHVISDLVTKGLVQVRAALARQVASRN